MIGDQGRGGRAGMKWLLQRESVDWKLLRFALHSTSLLKTLFMRPGFTVLYTAYR